MRTALIAGGSGLVGGHLLGQLLETPEYSRVVALVRRPLPLSDPKLEQVVVDFTALEKVRIDCDDAFCCLGTTIKQADSKDGFRAVDKTAVLAFAWAAQRNGARRFFVVSAMGASAQSRVFYNRIKGETEEALMVLAFPTLAIFRPGLLLGSRPQIRFGERIAAIFMWLAEPLLIGRLRKYRPIAASVVARAMVRCSFGREGQGVLIFPSDEIQDLAGVAGCPVGAGSVRSMITFFST
jgi:uncharacterized protein YbjT (DUF2867 family)